MRNVIPLDQFPEQIVYEKGVVSLIADPSDSRGDYMILYLVNDTDQTIPSIIGALNIVHSQVRFGGSWFSRKPMTAVCGTVPVPKDLPARHALALSGIRHDLGDIGGEIRYVFYIPGKAVASGPLRGRYFQESLREVMMGENLGEPLTKSFGDKLDGSGGARNLEEYCALLELARNYQLNLNGRANLLKWIIERAANHDATPEQVVAIRTMKAILSRPWMVENDAQSLADRSIAALEGKPSKIYGSPEKCRVSVWRYLSNRELVGGIVFAGNDRRAADRRSVVELTELAKSTLSSGDGNLADAAAAFLARNSTEDDFPAEGFLRFIESGRPDRISSGINGLSGRGKIQEAGPWLLDRTAKLLAGV